MGKSVVARLVETHEAVKTAFPNIVHVPRVGQSPDIKEVFTWIWTEQQSWLFPRNWESPEQGREDVVRQMGVSQRTLLVLDDVRTHEALQILNVCASGQHKLLVTTHSPSILSHFDETELKVFGKELHLDHGHAQNLLCMHAFPATGTPPQEGGWDTLVDAVTRRCKNVPLSLSVCCHSP
jgi:hypothetical protein